MNPLVSIRDVSKVYGSGDASVPALDGISLEVPAGEILLMMGPSGSGKTTLLSIMGCILRPTAGSVVICGRETSNLHERSLPKVRLSHIGFVFQGFNLFPTLSVLENVELALELKGTRGRAAKRIAGELLDRVGLSDKLAAFPANLSGGQKQRVAIARALAGDPEIVLADEPTAALDSTSGRLVMEMLQSLAHERGRAVVIVTHDNRTAHYADRVVRIEDGRLSEMTRTVARHDTFENRAETAHYF
jgi:putative ABC transport system ATP-binding protein